MQSGPGDQGLVQYRSPMSGEQAAGAVFGGAPAGRRFLGLGRKIFGRRARSGAPWAAEPVPSDVAMSVAAFHAAFGLPRQNVPTRDVPTDLAALRVRLLAEETREFADAVEAGDLTALADALADVVYVAYGSAVTYGIDLDAVLAEVHRSNMSKLDVDGRPLLREDGKVLKSSRYTPPDVAAVLCRQQPLPW